MSIVRQFSPKTPEEFFFLLRTHQQASEHPSMRETAHRVLEVARRVMGIAPPYLGVWTHKAFPDLERTVLRREGQMAYVLNTRTSKKEDYQLGGGSWKKIKFATREDGKVFVVGTARFDKGFHPKRYFQSEARLLKMLRGVKGVIQIEDSFETEEKGYLILPFMSGGDLCDAIFSGAFARLKLSVRLDIILQFFRALEAIHRLGIVHADVKAENVFLDGNGEVVLGDFGLAFYKDDPAQYKWVIGGLSFAAPELLQKREASPASDIWAAAAGVLFPVILKKDLPWDGDHPSAVYADMKQRDCAAEARRELESALRTSDYPGSFIRLAQSCFENQPDLRPTAAALCRSLEEICASVHEK